MSPSSSGCTRAGRRGRRFRARAAAGQALRRSALARPPYRRWAQDFILAQQWWQRATEGVPGVTRHHEQMVSFAARQWLDIFAPSNFVSTNPVVQRRTVEEGGFNLVRGAATFARDLWRDAADQPPAGAGPSWSGAT